MNDLKNDLSDLYGTQLFMYTDWKVFGPTEIWERQTCMREIPTTKQIHDLI